ncbi:hypothetical protein BpHYR1_010605 [Brachionus plicatilis]|uniref:Uncharacterized protein n=1 Tax=Brachionus plicatilis TaxID=10195 RepID=A0A3M7S762_BRAPC|nr:hypothetical protein BpHYR1_010605 [Brachionus plicatilis]
MSVPKTIDIDKKVHDFKKQKKDQTPEHPLEKPRDEFGLPIIQFSKLHNIVKEPKNARERRMMKRDQNNEQRLKVRRSMENLGKHDPRNKEAIISKKKVEVELKIINGGGVKIY